MSTETSTLNLFIGENDEYIINMGPQHPSTHGVLRLELALKGELVESHYAGGERTSLVRLPDGQTVRVRHSTENDAGLSHGSEVFCWWNMPSGVLVRDDREEGQ